MHKDARSIAENILASDAPDRLAAVLDRCGGDSELVVLVLSELGGLERKLARDEGKEPDPILDARVGRYRVLSLIGRGGNGAVYTAVRDEANPPRQLVAIKFIGRGIKPTEEVIRRFQNEREMVASLAHNYIVKLHDAGDSAWGLYFSMEFVRGLSLDVFCKTNRLTVSQRLGLFLKVCEAVRHLHRYGIVHRDLKPANVLVDSDGNPKLLDFGIAEYMEPERLGHAPPDENYHNRLTPEFAAPEVWRGERVTTAADVYSLGAILFLLLTGRTPAQVERLENADWGAQVPRASEHIASWHPQDCREPGVASLRKQLAGDLDAIVGKALSARPIDRYDNALELAADIRNNLGRYPVKARLEEGWRYEFTRLLRRHRAQVAAITALVISLSGGLGYSLYQRSQAVRARDVALERLNSLRALAKKIDGNLARIGPEARRAKAKFLEDFAQEFENLGDRDPDNRDMLYATALKLREGAYVEWNAAGDREKASNALERIGFVKGKQTRDGGISPALPDLPTSTVALAESYRTLGQLLSAAGDRAAAKGAYENCAAIVRDLPRTPETSPSIEHLLPECQVLPGAN